MGDDRISVIHFIVTVHYEIVNEGDIVSPFEIQSIVST